MRVVCATNRQLEQEIESGTVRQDLYYRINVVNLKMPPLRERRADIEDLANYFLDYYNRKYNCRARALSSELMGVLQKHHWPGNIRELQNLVERAVILSRGSTLEIPLTELKQPVKTAVYINGGITLEHVERDHILKVLDDAKWVIGGPTGAAARLGLNRTTLNHRMRKLGIMRPQPQPAKVS